MVVHVFCHAPQPVAAHLRFGTIGVEHSHAGIGARVRRTNQNQSIAADAEMPVGNALGQGRGVGGDRVGKTIDIHVVVADAVHFGKSHERSYLIRETIDRNPSIQSNHVGPSCHRRVHDRRLATKRGQSTAKQWDNRSPKNLFARAVTEFSFSRFT